MAQIMVIAALLLNISPMGSFALVRQFFIATRELEWDYAPGGGVFRTLEQQTFADNYIMPRENRIGNIYKKAGYFQYTDDTFKTEIPKPIYLGLLGPLIRAELDDVIQIHFYNNASRNYSIHPHGVFYLKNSESAQYLDNTTGIYKVDDNVPPGGKVVLEWSVTENNAPTDDDPNCLPWLYHAHVNAVQDVASGPIGVLITCKKGTLNNKNERSDVTHDFPLLVFNWDENLNWYIDYNIQTYCLKPHLCQQLNADGDPYFIDSNVKRSINALAFGTLPGLEVCVGDDVNFYVIGFGNEKDVHSLHFHGQNVKFQHVRGDTVFVYSATFVTAETTPTTEGKWLITDMVGDHEKAGTWAYYKVTNCEKSAHQPRFSKTRWYYLAAEEYQWNYARPQSDGPYRRKRSSDFDRYKSEFLSWYRVRAWSWPKLSNASAQFNANYTKAKFVRYTDGTFREEATRLSQDDHLGTLGPVLRAEVGERIKVTLKNSIPFDVSFLPHGVSYTLAEEAELEDSDPDVSVGQGHVHTYTFYVPTNLLDDASEPCKVFLYTSGVDPRRAQNTGLVGPLLICRKNHLTSYKLPTEQYFLLFSIIDEAQSFYSTQPNSTNTSVSDLKFSINGYTWGSLPGLDLCYDETVQWHVMSVGTELDVHTVTFDGNGFTEDGQNRDGRHLVPGETATLTMRPDTQGKFRVYSQSNLARLNGMFAYYNVDNCGSYAEKTEDYFKGRYRDYFIAAEEVMWDYAPLQRTIVNGEDLNDPKTEGSIFVRHDENFIGHIYKKAVFKEYKDWTFISLKPGEDRDILGPVMWVEVGDTLRVTFKNKASRPYSIYSHGLKKSLSDSGVDKGEVAPGQVHQYVWEVPERAGPGHNDPNCIPWLYYSSVNLVNDTNSGLVGPLVVCRPGILTGDSRRGDVDIERFVYMSVMNENWSHYLDENVRRYAPGRVGTDYRKDENFQESNRKHAINGRLYGNNNNLIFEYGQKAVLYAMSLGAEIDLHTLHLHGHTFVHSSQKHRDDVIAMFPGMAEAVEMVTDNPGTWLIHCHVLDHIFAGMETTYTVLPPGQTIKRYIDAKKK
ncbi:hypothetical protein Btru_049802 [Bulinus truncatus]|nr:hypothetical protein Btru_049802 [Bulinus truncatus]